jgi:hypothetical protein
MKPTLQSPHKVVGIATRLWGEKHKKNKAVFALFLVNMSECQTATNQTLFLSFPCPHQWLLQPY